MRPLKPPQGACPQDASRDSCNLQCKYNHFEADDLIIDSWELKCLDCGYRQTIGYRTDEPDSLAEIESPETCPFCGECGLATGKNPCQG